MLNRCDCEIVVKVQLTDLDEVGGVAEGELEGAVSAGEAERAGLVVTLEVVVSPQHPAQPHHQHRHQHACTDEDNLAYLA